MVEYFQHGLAAPVDVMRAIDEVVQDIADQHASRESWGTAGNAAAANEAAMARAGGPAQVRPRSQ